MFDGLLTHELGHVLGLRHEHIRPEAEGDCLEGEEWRPLTAYDSDSIMHYPLVECGGTGRFPVSFSARDIEGVIQVYGISTACGNGVVDSLPALGTFEQCDDGNDINGDGCRRDCTLELCGDGIFDPQEKCEDGNTINGDGCRDNCTVEYCGDGVLDVGEECELHHPANEGECRMNCTYIVCGDGIKESGEACDDGNGSDADGCRADCSIEQCGDGIVDRFETCDDGNVFNYDGCDASCTFEACAEGETRNPAGACVKNAVETESSSCQTLGPIRKDDSVGFGLFMVGLSLIIRRKRMAAHL